MKNDIILIDSGVNSACLDSFMGRVCENRLEFFNPNTRRQKILGRYHDGYLYENILLDDGRLFLTTMDKTKIILLILKNK